MLSAGSRKLKGVDCSKFAAVMGTGLPSTSHERPVAVAMMFETTVCAIWTGLGIKNNFTPPAMIASSTSKTFTIGKNRALPEGTVIVRTVVPPRLPARNQTRPLWLTAANCPVVSVSGFSEAGVSKAQRHHLVARSEADGCADCARAACESGEQAHVKSANAK